MSYNILFIDDSGAMQEAVSMIFSDNPDFKLNQLYDSSSLTQAIKESSPSIVIINYNLSSASSYNLVLKAKKDPQGSKIPILLIVPSDLSNNERDRFVELGISGFIYRPFDKTAFISKVKKVLGIIETQEKFEKKDNAKVYDISIFERKEKKSDQSSADAGGGESSGWETAAGSTKLSEAFERLFKDDVVYKEFQALNRTGGEEEPAKTAVAPVLASSEQDKSGAGALKESGVQHDGQVVTSKTEEERLGVDVSELLQNNLYTDMIEEDLLKEKEEGGIEKMNILGEDIAGKMDNYLKNSINELLREIKPQIIENIKVILPDIAERLLKEEIEKVKGINVKNENL